MNTSPYSPVDPTGLSPPQTDAWVSPPLLGPLASKEHLLSMWCQDRRAAQHYILVTSGYSKPRTFHLRQLTSGPELDQQLISSCARMRETNERCLVVWRMQAGDQSAACALNFCPSNTIYVCYIINGSVQRNICCYRNVLVIILAGDQSAAHAFVYLSLQLNH